MQCKRPDIVSYQPQVDYANSDFCMFRNRNNNTVNSCRGQNRRSVVHASRNLIVAFFSPRPSCSAEKLVRNRKKQPSKLCSLQVPRVDRQGLGIVT